MFCRESFFFFAVLDLLFWKTLGVAVAKRGTFATAVDFVHSPRLLSLAAFCESTGVMGVPLVPCFLLSRRGDA